MGSPAHAHAPHCALRGLLLRSAKQPLRDPHGPLFQGNLEEEGLGTNCSPHHSRGAQA